jgi:hypothetical protein
MFVENLMASSTSNWTFKFQTIFIKSKK